MHPVHQFDQSLPWNDRTKDFLADTIAAIERDDLERSEWLEKRKGYYRQRYCEEWRNTDFPWPGACDLVLPLTDMVMDRLKPAYVKLVTDVHPPVTVLALDPESQRKANDVELWFDWLLRAGSPDFVTECILAIDDCLEMGRGILKSLWLYETRTAPETLSLDNLDSRLLEGIVGTPRNAEYLFERKIMPLGASQFEQAKPAILKRIKLAYDLDPENALDRRAIEKLLAWLKSGAEEPLTIKKRDKVVNAPGIVAVSPVDLIMPQDAGSFENAARITHRCWLTEGQVRARAKDAAWENGAVKDFLERVKKQRSAGGKRSGPIWQGTREEEAIREGTSISYDERIEIHEICTWMDVDQDGVDEKVVFVVSPDAPDMPFKSYLYARPSGKWPYHSVPFELNKRRWYSPRGIPEKIEDLTLEITIQHRAKLNGMLLQNATTLIGRKGSLLEQQNGRWIPGQWLWTQNPAQDVVPLQLPHVEVSYQSEEAQLRTWVEQYIGSPDYGNSSPTSSLTEPRTATEIRGIQSQTREALSLRGTLFQLMMKDVYQEMFDLWHAFGPKEVWVNVTGTEPIRLTKEQLQGQYMFQCTGAIGEQDQVMEAQKAIARLQVALQMQQTGALGNQWALDIGELYKDALEKDDIRVARRVLRQRSPEEIEALEKEQAEQQEVQGAMAGAQMAQMAQKGGGGRPIRAVG